MQPARAPLPLEPHGERRRAQLVAAAAFVIESEGLDALRMPRVAELAGCARTLVYRYFPRREDLLAAVTAEFDERLALRLDPDAQAAGMRRLADRDAARPLLEAIWDVVAELGTAGLILHASPRLGADAEGGLGAVWSRFDERWIAPLRESGLGEVEASLVARSAVALLVELHQRSRRGEVTREQALALGQRALAAMVSALRAPGGRPASAQEVAS
jgi:AcrR family transcriptional regulator